MLNIDYNGVFPKFQREGSGVLSSPTYIISLFNNNTIIGTSIFLRDVLCNFLHELILGLLLGYIL